MNNYVPVFVSLCLFLCLSSASSLQAQGEVLFAENFENTPTGDTLPSGWLAIDADMLDHGPVATSLNISRGAWGVAEFVGNRSAVAVSNYTNGSKQANDWLLSPIIELGSESILKWAGASLDDDVPETYEVYITDVIRDSYATDSLLMQFDSLTTIRNESPFGLADHEWELSAYDGKEIRIAFRLISVDASAVLIDNIQVMGNAPTSIAQSLSQQTGISVYPNPVRSTLNLQMDPQVFSESLQSVSLLSISGQQLLLPLSPSLHTQEWDLATLSPGVYILWLQTDKAVYQEKISIR